MKGGILTEQPLKIKLPKTKSKGRTSIEETLAKRRSIRSYSKKELAFTDVSQLLWAAQGLTSELGFRTAPSAGALYPLEVYLVAGNVSGLEPGVYRYLPIEHALVKTLAGDRREELAKSALSQSHVKDAPADLVITAVYSRITGKYGKRGLRYAHMEAGHVAQNVYLQGAAIGVGTCAVGASDDEKVAKALKLPENEESVYILAIGYPGY